MIFGEIIGSKMEQSSFSKHWKWIKVNLACISACEKFSFTYFTGSKFIPPNMAQNACAKIFRPRIRKIHACRLSLHSFPTKDLIPTLSFSTQPFFYSILRIGKNVESKNSTSLLVGNECIHFSKVWFYFGELKLKIFFCSNGLKSFFLFKAW